MYMLVRNAFYRTTSLETLAKSFDASMLRQKSISANLANVTTPDYERIETRFEKDLRRAMDPNLLKGKETDSKHLPVGRPELEDVNPEGYRVKDITNPGEINNVDVDMEAAKLAENQMGFHFAAQLFSLRKSAIESVIRGKAAG